MPDKLCIDFLNSKIYFSLNIRKQTPLDYIKKHIYHPRKAVFGFKNTKITRKNFPLHRWSTFFSNIKENKNNAMKLFFSNGTHKYKEWAFLVVTIWTMKTFHYNLLFSSVFLSLLWTQKLKHKETFISKGKLVKLKGSNSIFNKNLRHKNRS